MILLGIETSCDETGAALLEVKENKLTLHSQSLASSLSLHATTGGIIPEIAAREQVRYILPVIQETLQEGLDGYTFSPTPPAIDGIAVTYGPGLIGSLLVGVETAKTLSLLWDKPLYPVNHLYGHIYSNFISKNTETKDIPLPALALVVSGGHTDLVLLKSYTGIKVIGGTRDDAAGEAFDKIGRLLNLPYPAGATIAKLAEKGNPKAFLLPRPMLGSHDFDFSFSGLKTAVLNLVKRNQWDFSKTQNDQLLADLCASVQYAIVDVLTRKTVAAAKKTDVKSILLGGGVAANQQLRDSLSQRINEQIPETKLFVPEKDLCTDNAAMIAAAAAIQQRATSWQDLTADPELYF